MKTNKQTKKKKQLICLYVYRKVVESRFLALGGEEFNLGPEMRLDHSELLCNEVLLKYKGDRESF